MRRPIAAIMLVTVAVALAACGGGTPATEGAAPTTAAQSQPPAPWSEQSSDTLSPRQVARNEPFPTSQLSVPADILAKLRDKRPILLVYVDSSQLVTADEWTEIDAVMAEYRGLIDLVSYDVADGLESVEASTTSDLQKAMSLAGSIGVKNTPYMMFIDRSGRVTGRFLGYTDRTLLEREVLRATS